MIKRGLGDKTFHKIRGFVGRKRISTITSRWQVVRLRSMAWRTESLI